VTASLSRRSISFTAALVTIFIGGTACGGYYDSGTETGGGAAFYRLGDTVHVAKADAYRIQDIAPLSATPSACDLSMTTTDGRRIALRVGQIVYVTPGDWRLDGTGASCAGADIQVRLVLTG
jgi:hypothetical protein